MSEIFGQKTFGNIGPLVYIYYKTRNLFPFLLKLDIINFSMISPKPIYENNGFSFFKLHEMGHEMIDKVAELLSDEWASRSASGRKRILESSSDDLPTHFVLMEADNLVGHIKLCRCLGKGSLSKFRIFV
jgi:hypothetical protein